MATKKSPVARMKDEHKDKETLVDHILDVIEKGDAEKDALKTKLLAASNAKLLRLFDAAREIKSKFGSREKLAETIATAAGKAKDKDYVGKLAQFTPARLLSLYKGEPRPVAAPRAKVKKGDKAHA